MSQISQHNNKLAVPPVYIFRHNTVYQVQRFKAIRSQVGVLLHDPYMLQSLSKPHLLQRCAAKMIKLFIYEQNASIAAIRRVDCLDIFSALLDVGEKILEWKLVSFVLNTIIYFTLDTNS